MKSRRAGRRYILAVAGVILAMLATVEVVTAALSSELANRRPLAAIRIRGDQFDALQNLAERALRRERPQLAAAYARRALDVRPMDAGALRVLALASPAPSDTERLLNEAARLTKRDTQTQLWLLNNSFGQGDFVGGYAQADLLLRRRPEYQTILFPAMIGNLDHQKAFDEVVQRLATKPVWRENFLTAVAVQAPRADMPFHLFKRLQSTNSPPTRSEMTPYFMSLLRAGAYAPAAAQWSDLTPDRGPAPAGVYNGGFDDRSAPPPFDWMIGRATQAVVEMTPDPDRNQNPALRVIYDGYSSPELLGQAWVLRPGRYVLSGVRKVSSSDDGKFLSWRIYCAPNAEQIGQEPLVPDAKPQAWIPFQIPFEVPAEGCEAQWVRLQPIPGERSRSIDVWYDDFVVRSSSTKVVEQ